MVKKWKLPLELLLVLITVAAQIHVVFAPPNNVMYWYSTDDGFYYFKVAQNIAEGFGSTFDRISLTNGYHPLWLLVCVPIFSLARHDLILPLRIVALVQILLSAGAGVLIFRLLRKAISTEIAWLAAAFWVFSPRIHLSIVEQGMESTLNAFCLLLLLYWMARLEERRAQQTVRPADYLWLSLAAVLALFSRLDNVFFVFLAGLWLAWRALPPRAELRTAWRGWLGLMARYFLPLGLALVLYMGWNYATFGTPSPVSGQIKRWWGTLPNTVYGYPVDSLPSFIGHWFSYQDNVGPWALATAEVHVSARSVEKLFGISVDSEGYKFLHRKFVGGAAAVYALALLALLRARWKEIRRQAVLFSLLPLFLGCTVQIISYYATHYISLHNWYWVSEYVFVVLAGAVLAEALYQVLLGARIPRLALQGAVVALTLLWLVTFSGAMRTLVSLEPETGYEDGYLWGAQGLEEATPPGSLIGTPGGGAVSYFIKDRTIINLDGLMNSYEYFQLLKAGRAGEYLQRIGLDYAYANQYMLTESDPYGPAFHGKVRFMQKVVGTALFQYRPDLNEPAAAP